MIEGEQAANANIVFSKLELLLLLEFVGIGIVSSEADKGGRKKYYLCVGMDRGMGNSSVPLGR